MDGDAEMADGGGDEENGKKRKVIYVLSFCFFTQRVISYALQRPVVSKSLSSSKSSNKKAKAASGSKKAKEPVEDAEDDD